MGLELQTRCTRQPAGLYTHPKRTPLKNSKDLKHLSKPKPRGPQGAERTHPATGQEGGCPGSPHPSRPRPLPGALMAPAGSYTGACHPLRSRPGPGPAPAARRGPEEQPAGEQRLRGQGTVLVGAS